MNRFSIKGSAAQCIVSHKDEKGFYKTFRMPSGAALLAEILHKKDLSDGSNLNENHPKLYVHANMSHIKDESGKIVDIILEEELGKEDGISNYTTDGYGDCAIQWGCEYINTDALEKKRVLWACGRGSKLPPKKELLLAENCFLMIDASLLRDKDALISQQISWERTSAELIWHLKNNPNLSFLLHAERILFTFAEDGAVYLRCKKGEIKSAKLTLTHGYEEEYLRRRYKRKISYAFTVMTAALAKQFEDVMSDEKELDVQSVLRPVKIFMERGYTWDDLKQCALFNDDDVEPDFDSTYDIPIPVESPIEPDAWCIAASIKGKRIFDIACKYVDRGIDGIGNLPRLKIGNLLTIDRGEIEAYQNIRNLINHYTNKDNKKPLSIAVFGAPGSGKSFGVEEIAKNTPSSKGEIKMLKYDISQFTGIHDLIMAFHKVREVRLEGKIPLVFFDEFDSTKDNVPFGWIKSFLMPMQDGKFVDESIEYPLGQCIFLFAGGTAESYEKFIEPMNEQNVKYEWFKSVKGPDFISRLSGTINIMGPNRKNNDDKNYILRRALLLRSFCESKEYAIDKISDNVLWAMLLVPKYKHGVRSVKSLLEMSRLKGNKWEPASLPFKSQLSLHVDADDFIKLVLRDTILNSYIEQLAKRIHKHYFDQRVENGEADATYAIPWEKLPPDIKESNRAQARHIPEKLKRIGYEYDCGDTPYETIKTFEEKELWEMAEMEHNRWINEKRDTGWIYNSIRDEQRKHHPNLIDWDKLSYDVKKKDYQFVSIIISLLESIGLRVYRID